MTEATETIRIVAEAGRRHATVEAWVAVALLGMTGLLADQGQAWHASAVAVTAGTLLGVAAFTAVRAFTWRREADKRERGS